MFTSIKWIASGVLAFTVGQGLFPTPNVVGGGAASMMILIFLTVLIKVLIDFLTGRFRKKPGGSKRDSG